MKLDLMNLRFWGNRLHNECFLLLIPLPSNSQTSEGKNIINFFFSFFSTLFLSNLFFFLMNKKKNWWSFLCVSVCFAVFVPFSNASLSTCCNWFRWLEAKWCQSFNLHVDYTLLRKNMFFHRFTPFLFNGIMLILNGHSSLVLKWVKTFFYGNYK